MLKQAQGSHIRGSLARAAERFLRRQVELEDSSPFHAAPAARAEHAARMSEAQVALTMESSAHGRARRPPTRSWPWTAPGYSRGKERALAVPARRRAALLRAQGVVTSRERTLPFARQPPNRACSGDRDHRTPRGRVLGGAWGANRAHALRPRWRGGICTH